jgi:hypothetical protein
MHAVFLTFPPQIPRKIRDLPAARRRAANLARLPYGGSTVGTWPLKDFMGNCHKIIAKGIDLLSALHLPSCLPSPPGGSACSKQNQEDSCRDA